MRAASSRLPQLSRRLPVLPISLLATPGARSSCLFMDMDFCAKRLPDCGRRAGGVEGSPLEFSLTFSCLTKDCPCLGFLLCGSWWWTEGTSLFRTSRMVSSLFFSPPSLQTILSEETRGWDCFGLWCREVCGLPLHRGAFGDVAEQGWSTGLAQALCTWHCSHLGWASLWGGGGILCIVEC